MPKNWVETLSDAKDLLKRPDECESHRRKTHNEAQKIIKAAGHKKGFGDLGKLYWIFVNVSDNHSFFRSLAVFIYGCQSLHQEVRTVLCDWYKSAPQEAIDYYLSKYPKIDQSEHT